MDLTPHPTSKLPRASTFGPAIRLGGFDRLDVIDVEYLPAKEVRSVTASAKLNTKPTTGRWGERMTSTIKKFFVSGTREVSSYDNSPYPVEISPDGAVGVEPKNLMGSKVVKDHIRVVAEIRKDSERGKK